VAAPGTAGIMGRSFLNCFGAVAFVWPVGPDGVTRPAATVNFYQEYDWADEAMSDAEVAAGLQTVPLYDLPCGLLSLEVTLNGVRMPALLDTGAPTTIVNRAAAAAAGLVVPAAAAAAAGGGNPGSTGNNNPFAGLLDAFGKGKEAAMADKGVMVMGAGGKPERLERVDGGEVTLELCTTPATANSVTVPVRCASVLVGELAAFQAGLNLPAPSADGRGAPGVLLGLDALMSRPRVVIGTAAGFMQL
jgi:hypothetical protein